MKQLVQQSCQMCLYFTTTGTFHDSLLLFIVCTRLCSIFRTSSQNIVPINSKEWSIFSMVVVWLSHAQGRGSPWAVWVWCELKVTFWFTTKHDCFLLLYYFILRVLVCFRTRICMGCDTWWSLGGKSPRHVFDFFTTDCFPKCVLWGASICEERNPFYFLTFNWRPI